MAVKGGLNEAIGWDMLNRMMEISTGESIRTETVEEWFNGWLADKKGSKAHGTYLKYEGHRPDIPPVALRPKTRRPARRPDGADVREYRDGLLKGGRTPGTANGVVKILRAPLNAARRQGLIAHNPAEGVEMLATDTNEKECFTPKQVQSARESCRWRLEGANPCRLLHRGAAG